MKRAALAVAVASALAGIVAVAANAALSLTFSTLRASPGDVVTVRTGGSGALAGIGGDGPPVQVFLIDADEVNPNSLDIGVTSPGDTRLIRLGELAVNAEGNGILRFAVPDVRGGEYTTVVHCVPCAPFSGGRELLATGPFPEPFVVLGSGATGDDGPWEAVILGVAGAVLLLVLVGTRTWRLRRRRVSAATKR
ncbi:MAG: hypothetical protein ACRDNB_09775 [Gaiellaceae bacterium]